MFLTHNADCIETMKAMPENCVDSVVTDPPYELGFMGKSWDASGIAFNVEVWQEALRVLKPGGFLLAFSGSRTYHRMAVAIEDAGFEIRDQIMWVYGSGFPKSHDVSKAIDKTNADTAKQWQGWGTALKPAHEPIVVARKPLIGTVAENVLAYGTGGLNIDGARVVSDDWDEKTVLGKYRGNNEGNDSVTGNFGVKEIKSTNTESTLIGRWPANFIHDGSDEVMEFLGEPSRFFYCAKASKRDRNEGLDGFEIKELRGGGGRVAAGYDESTQHLKEAARKYGAVKTAKANTHPTVKPTDLMRYLCRLVTQPGGLILDPFMGSGSTGKAAVLEGFSFIGIEQSAEYVEIANARIKFAKDGGE